MSADHSEARERARQDDCAITASGLLRLADAADECGVPRYANAYRLVAEKLLELNAQGKLRENAEQERWISVEERLPELSQTARDYPVMVICDFFAEPVKGWFYGKDYFGQDTNGWRVECLNGETKVTHWLKLPAPPVHKGDS